MRDESFKKLLKLKKYRDLIDFKSIECVVALVSTIIFNVIIFVWKYYDDSNDIVNAIVPLTDTIGIALIGFLGFIVTGLAILTGAISSKIVKRLQERNKMQTLERILLSFYLLGIISAFVILLSFFLHFLRELPIDSYWIIVLILGTIYAYFTVFTVFYAVKLIGNCMELFIIINEMQITDENFDYKYKEKYNNYRIIALEKLQLSKTSTKTIQEYRKCIFDLINMDEIGEKERGIYINMLKQQFGEDTINY